MVEEDGSRSDEPMLAGAEGDGPERIVLANLSGGEEVT
jgi:hypothetical protein